jgi:hypothetical protein
MKTRVQLYTVPGQVFYNETRKLVLKGVDGIVFVADSQETMLGANVESFKNLEENLKAHGMKLAEIPHVIQFNKRDLPKLSGIEDLNAALNKFNAPFYESVATTGIGVQDTLKAIVKLVLLNLTRKYEPKSVAEGQAVAPPAAAVAAMASTASVPAAPRRAAAPVAETPAAYHAAPETTRTHIPLSSIDPPASPRRSIPVARPATRKETHAPVEAITSFGEDEIDGLVSEVERSTHRSRRLPRKKQLGWARRRPRRSRPSPTPRPPTDRTFRSTRSSKPRRRPRTSRRCSRPGGPTLRATRTSKSIADSTRSGATSRRRSRRRPSPSRPRSSRRQPKISLRSRPSLSPRGTKRPAAPEGDLTLTDVASNDDLFTDPSLEIAQLADGQAREIIVPVMLGEGVSARRFKLAIRLRLDAVD